MGNSDSTPNNDQTPHNNNKDNRENPQKNDVLIDPRDYQFV